MISTDIQLKKWRPEKSGERIGCGFGLYVRGWNDRTKSFEFRTKIDGKTYWITVGNYPTVSLAEARTIVSTSKRLIKDRSVSVEGLRGLLSQVSTAYDLEALAQRKPSTSNDAAQMITFDEAFRRWYQLRIAAGKMTHAASKRRPLAFYENHAQKHIGNLKVNEVSRSAIKRFMQPLFFSHPEIASNLIGYIRRVLEMACDDELIEVNPCPTKPSFETLERDTKHAPSLDYQQLPELWRWLQESSFSPQMATAMRLAVVTAHRASVVANMRCEHYDPSTGIWSIPQKPRGTSVVGYMKSGRTFSLRLPKLLREEINNLIQHSNGNEFVFSVRAGKPINPESLRTNFKKFGPITTHGFRNTFKTWCLNHDVDDFLADRYVDHALKGLDKNYRRDDLFERRAALAEKYITYIRSL